MEGMPRSVPLSGTTNGVWRQILNQILFLFLKFLLVYLALGVSFFQNVECGPACRRGRFFVIVRSARLTCEPFDKRDNSRDYQDPPENHKNPAPPLSSEALAKGEHHIHHRHPPAASSRECRQCIATGEAFAHNNMDLFFAFLAVRLYHHRIHRGMRISGHLAHKVFAENSELFITQILASKLLCLEFIPNFFAFLFFAERVFDNRVPIRRGSEKSAHPRTRTFGSVRGRHLSVYTRGKRANNDCCKNCENKFFHIFKLAKH